MDDEFTLVDVTGFDTMDDISGLVDVDVLVKIEVDGCWFDVSGVDTMADDFVVFDVGIFDTTGYDMVLVDVDVVDAMDDDFNLFVVNCFLIKNDGVGLVEVNCLDTINGEVDLNWGFRRGYFEIIRLVFPPFLQNINVFPVLLNFLATLIEPLVVSLEVDGTFLITVLGIPIVLKSVELEGFNAGAFTATGGITCCPLIVLILVSVNWLLGDISKLLFG